MGLVERTKQRAAQVVDEGETLQSAFAGQVWRPGILTGLYVGLGFEVGILNVLIRKPLRVVVVTDRRYLVCLAGPLSRSKIRKVLDELPRDRPLAQPSGKWWNGQSLGPQMWVHKKFFDEIRAAERVRSVRKPAPRPAD